MKTEEAAASAVHMIYRESLSSLQKCIDIVYSLCKYHACLDDSHILLVAEPSQHLFFLSVGSFETRCSLSITPSFVIVPRVVHRNSKEGGETKGGGWRILRKINIVSQRGGASPPPLCTPMIVPKY